MAPLTSISTSEIWNAHYWVRGIYHRYHKSLQDKRLNLQYMINIDLVGHMEIHISASDLLGKCGLFWSQLSSEIEDFHLNVVTTTYGDAVSGSGR